MSGPLVNEGASFTGVTSTFKLIACVLAAMAFPSLLFWTSSADPLLMALAGGFHTFFGPIIGAAIFVFVNFYFAIRTEYALMILGILIIGIVLFLPGGVVGFVESILFRGKGRNRKSVGSGGN